MLCVWLLFCSLIVQGNGADVTPNAGEVTRFPLTESLTFLAHNNLDGQYFSQLHLGDEILVQEGEETQRFVVTEIISARASRPTSVYTRLYIDGRWMTTEQVYARVFVRGRLVLQTCIAAYGNSTWGRLFVIAEPVR